jgi:hypothetical protein
MSEPIDPRLEQLYEQKYLKYKKKYLELKRFAQEQEGGLTLGNGDATIITTQDSGKPVVEELIKLNKRFIKGSLSIRELETRLKEKGYIIFNHTNKFILLTPVDYTKGIKAVGSSIASGARTTGRVISSAVKGVRGARRRGQNAQGVPVQYENPQGVGVQVGGVTTEFTSNELYQFDNRNNLDYVKKFVLDLNQQSGQQYDFVIHMKINNIKSNEYISSGPIQL